MLSGLVLVLGTACGPNEPAEIRIGLLGPLEGPLSEASGVPALRGAELAVERWNADGGIRIGGRSYVVRLIPRHYAARADDAAAQARSLINHDSIHAVIGPQMSAHAIPVAIVAENARVPMISPMSSNPATTEGKRFVFRIAFQDDFQAEVLGRFAHEDLHANRAAVLYEESSAYSRDLDRRFRESFIELGGEIVREETYTADISDDFSAQMRRIAAARPEVLFLPNLPKATPVQAAQARAAGVDAVLLGSDTWDFQALAPMPEADGSYATHQWHYDVPSERARVFVHQFEEAFGRPPRTTAAMTYDAVDVMLAAIERVGSLDPERIRAAIATTDLEGVTGRISFDGRGSPRRSAVISVIRDGTVRVHRVVDP